MRLARPIAATIALALVLGVVSCTSPAPGPEAPDGPGATAGTVPVAGADPSVALDGWECFLEDPDAKVSDVWSVEDGVLTCRGTPRGYLHSREDHTDFTLELEWRWPPGAEPGRGGVLIRQSGPHGIWPKCLEAQINAGEAGDFWGLAGYSFEGDEKRREVLEHDTLGTLTHLPRTKTVERPAGEWNRYEIIARGGEVILRINGEEVNRATGCPEDAGPICITSEGSPIEFRNLRLR